MRRLPIAALPLIWAAACSQQTTTSNNVDINAAATAAQGDIDTYAANALQNRPIAQSAPKTSTPEPAAANPNTTRPPAPGEPGGLPDDRTPVSEAPFTPDSAQGAADVVQTYYALVESGKYAQAYRLWSRNGQASGAADLAGFARGFARYSEYHANVGAPGRVDSGAGQRYVTVPVQVYGRTRADGRPFNQRGDAILHRTEDIDGATSADKAWHIESITLKTTAGRPDATAGTAPADSIAPPAAAARYACADGYRFTVRFDNRADTAAIRSGNTALAVLDGQRPASGIWYKGGGYELRGKGDEATFRRPGKPQTACHAG